MARIPNKPAKAYPVDSLLQKSDDINLFVGETWNTSCWAYPFDLTCLSKGNTQLGIRGAGTAVTKRHVMLANHFHPAPGFVLRFLTRDNQIEDRLMTKVTRVEQSDAMVGELESDLSITPAKLIQGDVQVGEPLLCVSQHKEAIVAEVSAYTMSVMFKKALTSQIRGKFFHATKVYDSGHPIFLIRDQELFLVSHFTTTAGGPNYSRLRKSIEAITGPLS